MRTLLRTGISRDPAIFIFLIGEIRPPAIYHRLTIAFFVCRMEGTVWQISEIRQPAWRLGCPGIGQRLSRQTRFHNALVSYKATLDLNPELFFRKK